MSNSMVNKFENFLNQFSEKEWFAAIEKLLPEIHEVDRNAVQIWFRFYPLELFRYLQTAEDRDKAIQRFVMQGEFELKNQIDSSHNFLYGHRFWGAVKKAIETRADSFNEENADLINEVKQIAGSAAREVKVDRSLALGITLVGLMTVVQTGFEAFKNAKGEVSTPRGLLNKSPEKILAERAKNDSQGILGFLKTVDKKFTVVWNENDSAAASFKIINDEEIASASARNQSQNWREMDARCIEGVIPVECRSASCGTCWIGILGGQEKLSDVSALERRRMKVFGYHQPDDEKPFMRLACQARSFGNVTLVIPPWNGIFGKKVYGNVEEVELEPATTSAAKLRATIADATGE